MEIYTEFYTECYMEFYTEFYTKFYTELYTEFIRSFTLVSRTSFIYYCLNPLACPRYCPQTSLLILTPVMPSFSNIICHTFSES